MTIPNADVRSGPLMGDGVTTSFPFLMSVSAASDVQVIRQHVGSGVQTIETEGVTINTTLTGSPAGSTGGNVVFVTPPSSSYTVTIVLNPTLTQQTALPLSGAFQSTSVEGMADKVTNIAKRNRDLILRALTLLDGDTDGSGRFDANGNRITNLGAPTAGTDAATQSYVQSQIAAAVLDPSVTVSAQMANLLDETDYDIVLTLLGAGVKGLAIFKDGSNTAVLNELAFSALAQNLRTDTTAAAMRSRLEVEDQIPLRDWLVNSNWDVWQYGETFDATTPSAGANNDNLYNADQWLHLTNGSDVIDISRYDPATANDGRSGVTITQNTDNTKWAYGQIIEAEKTHLLRNQQVSLSLDIKTGGNNELTDFRLSIIYWTGTADDRSAAADPISVWEAATNDATLAAGWSYLAGATVTVNATGSWTTATIEGATIPATANNLMVILITHDGSFTSGAQVSLSRAHLVKAPIVRPTQRRTFTEELRECQRFFCKTFPYATVPAVNQGYAGALWSRTITDGASNGALMHSWRFPVEMVKAPTVVMLNPGSGGASDDWRNDGDTASNTNTAAVTGIGTSGAFLHATTNGVSTDNYAIHATATARL